MKGKMVDLAGKKIGRLTAIAPVKKIGIHKTLHWECICDCGNKATISSGNLLLGKTRSCGCLRTESKKSIHTKRRKIALKDHDGILEAYTNGRKPSDLALLYGVSLPTIYNIIKKSQHEHNKKYDGRA